MPALESVRDDIVAICQHLYQRGFIAGTEGNVSVRVEPDRVWITPSGCHKGFVRAEDLLLIDLSGARRHDGVRSYKGIRPHRGKQT